MTFTAKYPSRCAAGDPIKPGELIKYAGDELMHVNCDVPSLPNDRDDLTKVCRTCFTIHAGECW